MAAVEGVIPAILSVGVNTLLLSGYYTWRYNHGGIGRQRALQLHVGFPLLWYWILCAVYLLLVYLVTSRGAVRAKRKRV